MFEGLTLQVESFLVVCRFMVFCEIDNGFQQWPRGAN